MKAIEVGKKILTKREQEELKKKVGKPQHRLHDNIFWKKACTNMLKTLLSLT
jgi:hypothetical protein